MACICSYRASSYSLCTIAAVNMCKDSLISPVPLLLIIIILFLAQCALATLEHSSLSMDHVSIYGIASQLWVNTRSMWWCMAVIIPHLMSELIAIANHCRSSYIKNNLH